ncbi:MAG: radical SAM protein [Candidatus Cloacimonetes bacterium]|nr:radical SAM protein [Candidatus Cloacimonadota bacterium]MCF7813788.1 radical SAM protein [Candidatus Cloacimonadota bacterium]MCF7868340.1 radical SAM protein [Candidatus Cloacimonadota bacterium]MCF7883814.1 radical SAM protein [Candidatus Cloacimonadota bacterium]
MQLTEIFYSLQGESTFAGLPCIFIRTAGCNLRCKYCDTTYSYQEGYSLSVEQIINEIKKYDPIKLVEVTGGEPLLQDDIYELFDTLHKLGYKILLETNGSVFLNRVQDFVTKIVDVKAPGSGFEDSFLQENLDYLRKDKDQIKFVISDRFDYTWSKNFIENNKLQDHKVLFSLVLSSLQPRQLAEWIIEDKLPVRLQLQLHKYIWEKDQRGV